MSRGDTVRPSTLPLDVAVTLEGATEEQNNSNFHTLRAPVKFDTDGVTPHWPPPGRQEETNNLVIDDGPHIQIHRITCNQDFPSTWQPARRIITFMGVVSFLCIALVVVIVMVAVALSGSVHPRSVNLKTTELIYLIPQPRRFINRTPTIVVHRQNPKIWQRHVDDLSSLMQAYKEQQGSLGTHNCDLHLAPSPIGVSSCNFPLDRISENCTKKNNFGYPIGNPCVALVFNALSGWVPVPYNASNPSEIPEEVRPNFKKDIVPITCNTSVVASQGGLKGDTNMFNVHYSPFPGFPYKFLNLRGRGTGLPPLVIVQFLGPQIMADVEVNCQMWAKNLSPNSSEEIGHVRFSLFIV
nr:sodium/potassium-transporting ATPase subunit beta-like [Parasteatoda tepidariorum]